MSPPQPLVVPSLSGTSAWWRTTGAGATGSSSTASRVGPKEGVHPDPSTRLGTLGARLASSRGGRSEPTREHAVSCGETGCDRSRLRSSGRSGALAGRERRARWSSAPGEEGKDDAKIPSGPAPWPSPPTPWLLPHSDSNFMEGRATCIRPPPTDLTAQPMRSWLYGSGCIGPAWTRTRDQPIMSRLL